MTRLIRSPAVPTRKRKSIVQIIAETFHKMYRHSLPLKNDSQGCMGFKPNVEIFLNNSREPLKKSEKKGSDQTSCPGYFLKSVDTLVIPKAGAKGSRRQGQRGTGRGLRFRNQSGSTTYRRCKTKQTGTSPVTLQEERWDTRMKRSNTTKLATAR